MPSTLSDRVARLESYLLLAEHQALTDAHAYLNLAVEASACGRPGRASQYKAKAAVFSHCAFACRAAINELQEVFTA
jgi:hypothetical protein